MSIWNVTELRPPASRWRNGWGLLTKKVYCRLLLSWLGRDGFGREMDIVAMIGAECINGRTPRRFLFPKRGNAVAGWGAA